jgi:hypothetical protein
MSKTFIKKSYPVEKNVYSSTTIPDNFKDEIRKLATSGDYGKLKEKLTSIPINISFYENDISTSLLHSMIQSDLTEQQKNVIISFLLEKGVSVNVLDGDNLPPIYYAIKLHLTTIVESLIKYGANLSLSLPKGFDLFTTSLIPFETKCPTQLFNIQDSAYFNKYYNQSLDIEKEIKQKIYNLSFTSNIIKYLLSFCKNLPNDSLTVHQDTYESNDDSSGSVVSENEVGSIVEVEEEAVPPIVPVAVPLEEEAEPEAAPVEASKDDLPPLPIIEDSLPGKKILDKILKHQYDRFRELKTILDKYPNTKVILPGKAGQRESEYHALGKSPTGDRRPAVSINQWNSALGRDEDNSPSEAYNRMQEYITQNVTYFLQKYPDSVSLDMVDGKTAAGARKSHIHVWGANINNWNREHNEVPGKNFGSGQASAFNQQKPGVFGIITTPYFMNETSKIPDEPTYKKIDPTYHVEVPAGGKNNLIGGSDTVFNTQTNEEYKSKLPLFNNTLYKFVSNINQELSEQIKLQTLNIDQIILKQPELISKIVVQIENMLELSKVKKYPDINFDTVTNEINFDKLNRDIYNQIYKFGDNSFNNLDTNLILYYSSKIENIRYTIDDYKQKLTNAFETLMTTESNLFKSYPIFKPGSATEYPMVVGKNVEGTEEDKAIDLKINNRLFYNTNFDLNELDNLRQDGGKYIQRGGVLNKLTFVITNLTEELNKKEQDRTGKFVPIHEDELYNNILITLDNSFPGNNIVTVPIADLDKEGYYSPISRNNITKIRDILKSINDLLNKLNPIGLQLDQLLVEKKLRFDKINEVIQMFIGIKKQIEFEKDKYLNIFTTSAKIKPETEEFNNSPFNKLLEELQVIISNINKFSDDNIPKNNDSHLFYDKILSIFEHCEEKIKNIKNPIESVEDFRKSIFYYNAIIQIINHVIVNSNIYLYSKDEINLDELNISNIISDQKIFDDRIKYKNEFNDNYELISDIQESILVEYDINIRQFNNFIIDYNNITEIKYIMKDFGVKKLSENVLKNYYNNYLPPSIKKDDKFDDLKQKLNQLNYPTGKKIEEKKLTRKIVSTGETLGLTHLFIISELFHKKIFDDIITEDYFDELKQKLKEKNKNINDTILNKLLLKSINDAIISAFNEILEIVIYNASTFIINQLLFKNVKEKKPKLEQDLKSRLERRITFQSNTENRNFYLNENYSNSEPIDVILCLNNKNPLIVLLKSKLSVNLREYRDLLFKLGDVELINNLNELTNKKITKLDIEIYIVKHDQKFDSDIKYLNNQLDDDIIKQSLEFIKGTSKIVFTEGDRRKTIDGKSIDEIYNDMIGDQKLSNEYLTKNIKDYLFKNYNNVIIPLIKEFLNKLVNITVSNVLDTKSSIGQEIISNTIDNIIIYHLKVNPLKSKDKNMSLNEILTKFNTSFIFNFDDPVQKQNIKTIFDEKLNDKLTTYIMLISQYGLNVYRNQLRYIFNTARYTQIENNLK